MSLVRFTPFETLDTFRDQLLKTYESEDVCYSSGNWYLPVEIIEDDSNFQIRSIAAGMNPEDITLEYENGILTIACELTRKELEENEKIHMSDFCYGKFKRSVKVGQNVDSENITASYNQGILNITIPKASTALKKTIAINCSENSQ